jgi:tRNA wybutosine-synthesizing protein 1
MKLPKWDEPETIVKGCRNVQSRLLSGYKGNPKISEVKFRDASIPRHVAISLAGEPTLYPFLSDLIACFHKQDFTTFLVSNGTVPNALSKLSVEPTQLYVSLCAFDKKSFQATCRPQIPKAWEKLNETLSLLQSFKCRKVIRITLVKGLNMDHAEKYARLVKRASPDFVEPKAYMHVGFSRLRLGYQNTPSHSDIQNFAVKLASLLGFTFLDQCKHSRVVLLSKYKDKPSKLP